MANNHRIMEMIASGQPCSPCEADYVTLREHLISCNLDSAEMSVHAKKAKTMIQEDSLTINTQVFGKCNASIVGSRHW